MKLDLDRLAKQRISYPFRKLGLLLARRWPWPVRARLVGGTSMWVDLRSSVGRAILVKGEFDSAVWQAIERHLRPGAVFLDVGANVGYYSMLAADRVGRSGRVYSFEIDPRPLRCLRRNAKECLSQNIAVVETAVGSIVGQGVLVAAPDCGHSQVQQEGRGARVPMTSLDHWINEPGAPGRVDAIKLDIEGGELLALEGARKLIAKYRPAIVCEALDEKLHENVPGQARLFSFLWGMGYAARFADNVHSPTIIAIPNRVRQVNE